MIGYQQVQIVLTEFRLWRVDGLNNFSHPVSYVVWATRMCHAVEAAEDYTVVDEEQRHIHLMRVTNVERLSNPERDATPDNTVLVWDAREWGMQNAGNLAQEVEMNKRRAERLRGSSA